MIVTALLSGMVVQYYNTQSIILEFSAETESRSAEMEKKSAEMESKYYREENSIASIDIQREKIKVNLFLWSMLIRQLIWLTERYQYNDALEFMSRTEIELSGEPYLMKQVDETRQEILFARDLDQIHRVNRDWRVVGVGKGVEFTGVAQEYRKTFERYGFNVTTDSPEVVATKIRALRLREQVLSHLDDWRKLESNPRRRAQVIRVLQLADPDSEGARRFDPPPWLAPAPREVRPIAPHPREITPIAPPPRAITRP